MAPDCPDCGTELVDSQPVTVYDEEPLKLKTGDRHDGVVGGVFERTPELVSWFCPDCRRVFLYGKEPDR